MIGRLPKLTDPERFAGLYIFDFGDHVAVGYTAGEIDILLAEPAYASGTVYRIHRAEASGQLEIHGVNPASWSSATGLVFWFDDDGAAADACDRLRDLAEATPPPGRVEVLRCRRTGGSMEAALVLRYVQELDEAVSRWLLGLDFDAGVKVEAGLASVQQALTRAETVDEYVLPVNPRYQSRTREDVLAAVAEPVQR